MAIKTIRISDETLQKYQEMHPQNPSLAIESQLERFKDFSYKERVLLFPSKVRQELEKIVGKTVEDAEDFLGWVKKLATFKVEGVEFALSDGQRKRLEGEARFAGQPLDKFVEARLRNAIRDGIGA